MRHKILITGGAGFIGYNSAIYFKKKITKCMFLITCLGKVLRKIKKD